MDKCPGNIIVILNKIDLSGDKNTELLKERLKGCTAAKIRGIVPMSAKNGEGQEGLEELLKEIVYNGRTNIGESQAVCDARHEEILRRTVNLLEEALNTIDMGMSEDFIVIDLRSAWEKLGEITGETFDDDIVNQVFSNFCIGK